MDLASWFVCLLGMGVVFLGLICLTLLVFVVGFFSRFKKVESTSAAAPAAAPSAVSAPAATTVIENRSEIVAAVSAALAEELGEDVSSIRILSFKKIGG